MGSQKQAEYRNFPVCKIRFRLSRSWKIYCSERCAKKAKRNRSPVISSVIQAPSIPPNIAGAKNGVGTPQNDGQTDKKCLPSEIGKPRYESLLVRGPNGRKWGLNPRQVTAAMLEAEGIKKMPLLAVMKSMCADCRAPEEVVVCARPACPLWPYRDGRSPWKRGDVEESPLADNG